MPVELRWIPLEERGGGKHRGHDLGDAPLEIRKRLPREQRQQQQPRKTEEERKIIRRQHHLRFQPKEACQEGEAGQVSDDSQRDYSSKIM